MHLVAEAGEHPADLAVLALVEHHLEYGALLVLRTDRNPLRVHLPLGQTDAAAKSVDQLLGGHTGDLHEVFFLHAIPRMSEEVGEAPVVGEQNQSLTHAVQPTDREEPQVARHQINDAGPARRVDVGGDDPDRFVEHENDPLRIRQSLAVDADLLGERIDTTAERGHHLPVNLDASRRDQFLAGTPAAQARRSQHLLQPLQPVVGSGNTRPVFPVVAAP